MIPSCHAERFGLFRRAIFSFPVGPLPGSCEKNRRNLLIVGDSLRCGEITLVLEILDDDLDGILDARLVGADVHLGLEGLLVGGADAGELGDLALAGLLVQALGVALLGDLDGDVDPDLDKGQAGLAAGALGLVQRARQVAVGAVRADEAGDGDGARVGEQLGHLGDAADVLLAVLGREAQVLVQAEPDVVAVQAVRALAVWLADERLLERHRDRGLAARRQAGQPDRQTLLFQQASADAGGQRGGVIVNVAVATVKCVVSHCALSRCRCANNPKEVKSNQDRKNRPEQK